MSASVGSDFAPSLYVVETECVLCRVWTGLLCVIEKNLLFLGLGRLVACLTPRRPGFGYQISACKVRIVAMRQVFLRALRGFPCHHSRNACKPSKKKQCCFRNREVLSKKVIFTSFAVLLDERVCTHYVFCNQFSLHSFSVCEIRS